MEFVLLDDEMKLFEGLEPGELPPGTMGSELTSEEDAKLAKIKRQQRKVGMGKYTFLFANKKLVSATVLPIASKKKKKIIICIRPYWVCHDL